MTKIINYWRVCVPLVIVFITECSGNCSDRTTQSSENSDGYITRIVNYTLTREIKDSLWHNFAPLPYSTSSQTIQVPIQKPNKKLTKKQYEIINMFLRKTKIFVDLDKEGTTQQLKLNNITTMKIVKIIKNLPIYLTTRSPETQTSTPSNIEFYYWHGKENSDENDCPGDKCKLTLNTERMYDINFTKPNSSFVMFHFKSPLQTGLQRQFRSQNPPTTRPNLLFIKQQKGKQLRSKPNKLTPTTNTVPSTHKLKVSKRQSTESCKQRAVSTKVNKSIPKPSTGFRSIPKTLEEQKMESTTNDKIKFFEMYDNNTPEHSFYSDYNENAEAYKIRKKPQRLMDHADHGKGHEHNNSKLIKKHINRNNSHVIKPINVTQIVPKKTTFLYNILKKVNTGSPKPITKVHNKTAEWTDYPFTAVYIYEPSQVHCDAAGINSHWLVASASCLTRLSKNPHGQGQSAFVTFCGDNWWQPNRISYVKYTLVHPSFHPTDKVRRYLYNIGVIQVVTSMASCSGWSPITIMSHQFTTDAEGSQATAVGWGLDRFDTRYGSMELPKHPLMIYRDRVYSNSCPGNDGYRKAKHHDEGGVKNVYCLSLPPYFGEASDPVHGSLLLVGGKLIALYLQEERRLIDEQSAQYTGIWRLLPWISEVAKVPEEIDMLLM